MAKKRAVFLDRDGTINEEREYLYRVKDFVFIPGVPEAIRKLREAGFLVVVVTNQSGVGRGYYTLHDVEVLHRHIQRELARFRASIDAFYVCPHHPQASLDEFRRNCSCRKGQPGMLLQAAAEHHIDLANSFMVGDKASDVQAGKMAGCTPLLVLTGYGGEEAKFIDRETFFRFRDLGRAVDYILSRRGRQIITA